MSIISKKEQAEIVKRIHDLCAKGRLNAEFAAVEYHIVLGNPETGQRCVFYPTRGTIVRDNVRQAYRGFSAALKTIGVRE